MIDQILPYLYRISVSLPQSPLKSLNAYVVKTNRRNLLIDTGFNRPECLNDLKGGISELGISMNETDIFVTHLHADHSGLVSKIASPESKIYMNAIDKGLLDSSIGDSDNFWNGLGEAFVREGYPAGEMKKTSEANPAKIFCSSVIFPSIPVNDKDIIKVGDMEFQCVSTPGHTPGHMCLYGVEDEVMFTGDHVLFDITPNITPWSNLPNALGCYIDSLNRIKQYEVDLTLTGHRENNGIFTQRIDKIIEHHRDRLGDTKRIIAENPGIGGYELASKMKWSIRVKNWEDFPPGQRWFAVGETIAHVDYLLNEGSVRRNSVQGLNSYEIEENRS